MTYFSSFLFQIEKSFSTGIFYFKMKKVKISPLWTCIAMQRNGSKETANKNWWIKKGNTLYLNININMRDIFIIDIMHFISKSAWHVTITMVTYNALHLGMQNHSSILFISSLHLREMELSKIVSLPRKGRESR